MFLTEPSDYTKENLDQVQSKNYDCIICGGGTSGLVSALTLLQRGKTVALIEAGPFSLKTHITNTELRFQYPLIRKMRQKHVYNQTLHTGENFGPNISCLGGRGMFWNGAAPRFQSFEFTDWPFDVNALSEHYAWMEDKFRVSNTAGKNSLGSKIINSLEEIDIKAIAAPFAFNDQPEHEGMIPSGVSSGLAMFLREASSPELIDNIDLFTEAFAEKIDLDENGDKATGVTLKAKIPGKKIQLNSRNVVVACGALESTKLVSNSGIKDPHSQIGIGIQEHLFYRTFWKGDILNQDNRTSAAVFVPSQSLGSEQIEIHAPGGFLFATDHGGKWNNEKDNRNEIMIRSFAATRKSFDNKITFNNKELGGSQVHFTRTQFEEDLMQKMKTTVTNIGNQLGLELARDGFAPIGGSYHEAGGLALGKEPQSSVTSELGSIHTCSNLFAVDASVFPRIGASNPHLTIGAVARKHALNVN